MIFSVSSSNLNRDSDCFSPGRFFAVNQMKALIAHIIVTYDFKLEEGKGVPPERHFGLFRAPGDADVLFRERRK